MKRDGFCNSKDLIPASLEGHDIRLEQIQSTRHRARSRRCPGKLHLHEEVLAEPLARYGDPYLVVLLVGVEEVGADLGPLRYFGERPRAGALLRRALRGAALGAVPGGVAGATWAKSVPERMTSRPMGRSMGTSSREVARRSGATSNDRRGVWRPEQLWFGPRGKKPSR